MQLDALARNSISPPPHAKICAMSWEIEWQSLVKRLDVWSGLVDGTMRQLVHAPALRERANRALGQEAHEILDGILALALPQSLADELSDVRRRLDTIEKVVDGERVLNARWIVLAALRIPLDNALRANEGTRRRLVERAFVHLNRMLAVDEDVRTRWERAFAQGETRCEQLGGLHLLSHGIYAFKADAGSGRTDLILGDRLLLNDDVRAAEAMVLTEWKIAHSDTEAALKFKEARQQAAIYATNELGGFELRKHRYVVVVTTTQAPIPASDIADDVTYHYVNIATDPRAPSAQARIVR